MNPSLAAGAHAVSAAEARVTQAGLLPNPEIGFEAENFGGGGDLDGFNAAESTAVISQPILLGGKRGRRRAVAEAEQTLAGRELQGLRLDVVAGTTSAFYRVLGAQQRVALAHELLGLAERFARTVQAKVDAGKVSPIEASRASIEVAQARVGLARAVRELEAVRVLLAATWGSSTATFDRAAGELPEPTDPPSLGQLRQHLIEAPEVTRLEDQIEREKRILELETSSRVPDLTVSVGPRRFEETGQSAWVARFSLPIPMFDRNQGSRRAAEFDLERTRRDAEAVRVGLEAELASALERLRAVAVEATTMSQEIVPAANAAFAATETGYRKGKLGFLNVLDAQRTLFETRSLLLDSREEYATTRTELERLVGHPLGPMADAPTLRHDTSQGEER
jgi:cobalt-zinc-cadmium efflux system outer membrane protein